MSALKQVDEGQQAPGSARSRRMDSFPRPSRLRLVFLSDLLRELVARDMRLRYKRTVLGVAWSLVNPIAQLVVLGFIFGKVLPLNIEHYLSFLFTGLLAWSWLSGSLLAATTVLVDNAGLMRRPGFPAPVLPLAVVTTQLVHFLFALPILLVAASFDGKPLTLALLVLPVVIAIQFVLTLGLGFVVSTLQVTYRDTQHLLGVFLMLTFYLSPVFYDGNAIPDRYLVWYEMNPMYHLLGAYRSILVHGEMPHPLALLVLGAFSAVVLGWGYIRFRRVSHAFVEEI